MTSYLRKLTFSQVTSCILQAFTVWKEKPSELFSPLYVHDAQCNNSKFLLSMIWRDNKINCGFLRREIDKMDIDDHKNLEDWCKTHPGCETRERFEFKRPRGDQTVNIHFGAGNTSKPFFNFHVQSYDSSS